MNFKNNMPVLTVSQLTQAIKINLESTFPNLCLQGEISNFKVQTSGHYYFSLKDTNAQISAVMFRSDTLALKFTPKSGDQVIIRGELTVYPPNGNYQILVRELSLMGLGELLLKLEELKVKLHKKGWFSKEHKKPLPKFPKRIGVVTSPTGAAIHDILNILTRRYSGFHLILNPVRVQGEGAAKEIAQAIEQFNQYELADVLIVGRGGGSIEDLWAFNEELVASAIFHSKIPIISAVGHETDHCIADYVADVRAPTPSAAAEIVIAEKNHQLEYLSNQKKRAHQFLCHLIKQYRNSLISLAKNPLFSSPYALLGRDMQKLDFIRSSLEQTFHLNMQKKRIEIEGRKREIEALSPIARMLHCRQKLAYWQKAMHQRACLLLEQHHKSINHKTQQLDHLWQLHQKSRKELFRPTQIKKRLDQLILRSLLSHKEKLYQLTTSLKSIDPKNLLKKGYSILFSEKNGWVIKSVEDLERGEKVRLLLSDGQVFAIIEDKKQSE